MKEWPRLFISHHKAIVVVSPRAFWDFILFIDLAHLLVSFHFFFLPDIFTEWKSLIRYVFTCIPHMFENVHIVMHLFLHCILLYVHKTKQEI